MEEEARTDVLAPNYVFHYFQILGFHSPNKNKSYELCWKWIILWSIIAASVFQLIKETRNFEGTILEIVVIYERT